MKYQIYITSAVVDGKKYTGNITTDGDIVDDNSIREDWEPMTFENEQAAWDYVNEHFPECRYMDILKVKE